MWNGPIRFVTHQHFSSWRQFHVLVFDLSTGSSAVHDMTLATQESCGSCWRRRRRRRAFSGFTRSLTSVLSQPQNFATQPNSWSPRVSGARWGRFEGANHKMRADRRPVAANPKRNPVKLRLFCKRPCTASGRFYLYSARPRDSRIIT